jgi:glycosyltransferase involved in cell wall biosynthesis
MSPMKMFEYMAAGRPIISSNLPVLKEVLVEKLNALLVTPDDVSEWVEAANLLQENPELSNRIALSARSDYESEYNWCTRALKLRSLINNVS